MFQLYTSFPPGDCFKNKSGVRVLGWHFLFLRDLLIQVIMPMSALRAIPTIHSPVTHTIINFSCHTITIYSCAIYFEPVTYQPEHLYYGEGYQSNQEKFT